jgi:SLA1 homology domain 1, SHD1
MGATVCRRFVLQSGKPPVFHSPNLISFFLLSAFVAPAAGEMRIWTDASGQQQVEAEFVTFQADKVWFHRPDGRVVGAPLETLSEKDRAYVRDEIRRREKEKGTTKNPSDRIPYGLGQTIATLKDIAIDESSGVACSRALDGAFWTHNDSGGDAQLYLFDRSGRDLGSCRLEGVDAFDWEDMASFVRDGKNYLLVGDCGNNGLAATIHVLHLVEEPQADLEKGVRSNTVPVAQTIFFTFEDDHRDCEALAVDTNADCIYFATKQREGGTLVYELPWSKIEPETAIPAKRIATLDIPPATAMDISPDGRRAVILTYGEAYEYQREGEESWQEAFAKPARKIVVPERIQGESICYGRDGKTLYLTSEKLPTPVIEVEVTEEEKR